MRSYHKNNNPRLPYALIDHVITESALKNQMKLSFYGKQCHRIYLHSAIAKIQHISSSQLFDILCYFPLIYNVCDQVTLNHGALSFIKAMSMLIFRKKNSTALKETIAKFVMEEISVYYSNHLVWQLNQFFRIFASFERKIIKNTIMKLSFYESFPSLTFNAQNQLIPPKTQKRWAIE